MKRCLPLVGSLLISLAVSASNPGGRSEHCKASANLSVNCSRASSLIQIHVANCKRIGRITMDIKDVNGRVLYHEEGKALTGELVRRLDKHVLPRGTHYLSVTARDFVIAQPLVIE